MKKIYFLFIVLITITLSMVSSASGAIVFTETKSFNYTLQGIGTYSWEHSTPADFSVPHDRVNSATLTVDSYVRDLNDTISVQGTNLGVLKNSTNVVWLPSDPHPGLFDITSFYSSWAPGDVLYVTLNYNEIWSGITFQPTLFSSTLALDYTPVPEPASMLLLASGLVGLAGFRKRFKRS